MKALQSLPRIAADFGGEDDGDNTPNSGKLAAIVS
jgi:hypothetical protein